MIRASFEGAPGDAAVSETELIEAAKGGDSRAFGALVRRYQNVVSAMAFALTGQLNLSEDIAQETFVVTWRQLHRVEPEHFRRWLLGVAKRESWRALRTQRRKARWGGPAAAADDLPSTDPSPLDRAISREEEALIWHALKRIPETYRIPLVLFYREQQSLEAVAEMLDLSETNVRVRLTRGRRMLQQHMVQMLESTLGASRLGKAFAAATLTAVLMRAGESAAVAGPRVGFGRLPVKTALVATGLCAAVAAVLIGGKVRPGAREKGALGPERPGERTAAGARLASLARRPGAFVVGASPADDPAATASAESGTRILAFDFEDGLLPQELVTGHVVPGPSRPGSRFAAMSTVHIVSDDFPRLATIFFTEKLHYRDTLVLRFDYWIGPDEDGLDVELRNATRVRNYGAGFGGLARQRWAHLAVPLSILTAPPQPRGAMESGDELVKIKISARRNGADPFYIDNVHLVDHRADQRSLLDGIAEDLGRLRVDLYR